MRLGIAQNNLALRSAFCIFVGMKIVYCTDSLNHLGGIQRATTVKASALAAIAGNEIYVATAEGAGMSIFPLDARVKIVDLDVHYYSDD